MKLRKTRATGSGLAGPLSWACAIFVLFVSTARAELSQDAVFRSIEDNVSESGDSRVLIFVLCAMAAMIMVLALFGRRSQREVAPKAMNNPQKLLREVIRTLPLRSAEVKQLKLLCDAARTADDHPLTSPLTLLLCPSILARSLQGRTPAGVKRKVIAQVWRKLQPRAPIRP